MTRCAALSVNDSTSTPRRCSSAWAMAAWSPAATARRRSLACLRRCSRLGRSGNDSIDMVDLLSRACGPQRQAERRRRRCTHMPGGLSPSRGPGCAQRALRDYAPRHRRDPVQYGAAMTAPEIVEYDEFGLFHENAAEYGLPFDGPPTVRRDDVEVEPGRKLSALVWGEGEPELVFLHGG